MKKLLLMFVVLFVLAACSIPTQNHQNEAESLQEQINPTRNSTIADQEAAESPDLNEQRESEVYEAHAIINDEFIYSVSPTELFERDERNNFLRALDSAEAQFNVNGIDYFYQLMGEDSYRIFRLEPVVEVLMDIVTPVQGRLVSEELIAAYWSAAEAGMDSFEHQGIVYVISTTGRLTKISTMTDAAIASKSHLETYNQQSLEVTNLFEFRLGLQSSLADDVASFVFSDEKYTIFEVPGGYTILDTLGNLFAEISNIYVIPLNSLTQLPLEFKNLVRESIESGEDRFGYGMMDGEEIEYLITETSNGYSINSLNEKP